MKPPAFDYVRAASVEHALEALAADEAKLIAGGQSLMPMLNFRLLRPSRLVDINRLTELAGIDPLPDGGLRIGALTRHRAIEFSILVRERYPVLHAAVAHIGHLAIRNRGTIGGSLSHADPAAEHLLMSVLLDAWLAVRSKAGTRRVPARDHVAGALTTTLAPDELVTAVELAPLAPGTGWAFEEVARRSGDFALAAAAVLVRRVSDRAVDARIAVAGGVDGPQRVAAAEAALNGSRCEPEAIAAAAAAVRDAVKPNADLHASPALRHRILATLVERTCADAWRRATQRPS